MVGMASASGAPWAGASGAPSESASGKRLREAPSDGGWCQALRHQPRTQAHPSHARLIATSHLNLRPNTV